jgi:HK97 family phage major capsid protein
MTVIELREKAVQEAQLARDIKDKADQQARGLTTEEAGQFDSHLTESERLEKEAARQEKLEAAEKRLNEPAKRQVPGETANGDRIDVTGPDLFRFGQLRAFKGPKASADAYASGQFLLASIMGNAKSRQWCRDRGIELRVQTEGVNTAGGFVVPDVMERAIIDLRETYGMFRQSARVLPMSSDHSIVPRRTGGVTAYFVGESSAITESDKSWNQVELTAKKLGALTRMSTDLSEDAIINIADDLAQEMAYAFAAKEDACGIDGDGTSTYGGMFGIRPKMIDGNHAGSYVEAITAGHHFADIDALDLTNVMGALPVYARANAKWYCSAAAKSTIFDRLATSLAGNNAATVAAGALPRYMGYPIVEGAAMPAGVDTDYNDAVMLWFGDMTLSSTFGDRRGITIQVSSDRYMEYDQIGVKATERFCIVNHDIGGTTGVRGPIVGLLGTT